MNNYRVGLIGCAIVFTAVTANAQSTTHPFSVHDMLAMDRISDPQVSPDNQTIVFVRRKTDLEANKGSTDLWMVDLDGNHLRRLTSDPAGDYNPRFSVDGKHVYFLSSRSGSGSGSSQIWRIATTGGVARQISYTSLDISAFMVSPVGTYFVLAMDVFPNLSPAETKAKLDHIAEQPATGRIYDKIFVRHWDTWKDGRRSHLFSMPIQSPRPDDQQGRDDSPWLIDLMKGMDADCPTKPFGGSEDFTISPSGRTVVFTARDVGLSEAWSTDFDLYAVPMNGTGEPICITEDNQAWDAHPVFSPDGKTLAYLAMKRPGYESDRFRIMLRDWPRGSTRTLTESWDRSPGTIVFSRDSKTIFTVASYHGQRPIFSVDVETGRVRTVHRNGSVGALARAGDTLIFGMDDLQSPVELYRKHPTQGQVKPITNINASQVAAARMGDFEQFSFKGWNHETVYGYVVKPVDFDPLKKYPVAFLIHGGPQGSFGNHFHYRWNPQAYAGAGYAAIMIDFHGSTGYGQAFCDSIRGDWGGKPLEDLQKGLAAALKRYPWMDGDHVSALGASYGGYMINWIAGNWSDRFRCLINHDGNLDERAAYFMTEELWFPEWDHLGTPWYNPRSYEKHNPVNFIINWKTPMLVIHGALDYRVVDTAGISTFNVLQRRGIPSKFLYFPDENHWVLQPHNSILWHDTVIDWLDRWTK